jgi:large subunit ribosomal protein L29
MAKTKKVKAEDYRTLDDQSLVGKIGEDEMQLKKLHFSHSVNPIENPLAIRTLRRNIARMKTEQRRRALGF